MNNRIRLRPSLAILALGLLSATAVAAPQGEPQQGQLEGVEPVVPVGPAVVPVAPVGPATVPVAPVESLDGVETVTVNTPRGPVVVISFPVSGNVSTSAYNIDFSAIDGNSDGMITRAEAQAMAGRSKAAGNLNEQFAAAHFSNDGKLTIM